MGSPKPWAGYTIAVAATAVAALIRTAYDFWFGPEPAYLIPFLIPVVVAGWYAGLRCGLFATALNACVAAYFFAVPIYSFRIDHPGDVVRVGVFVAVGVGITLLNHQLHRYRRQAEEHVRESLVRQAALEREVADRREAEKLLLEHREKLRDGASALKAQVAERTREVEGQRRLLDAILDALPAAVIIADPTGRITRMNRACEQVWGHAPMSEGIAGYGEWVGYWPATGRRIEPHEWAMSRALLNGEACPGELVEFERFGDGSRRFLLNAAAPLFGTDGEVVAGVVATVDVTDRIAAERAAREHERRFRACFHTQFQFVGLMSPDGVLLEANRTALVAAGVTEGQVLDRPFWETVWWTHDPAQQDRLREAVRRAAAGQPDRFEASHPRADGTLMWVDFSITPFTEGGLVTLLIPEGRDITERKRVEAAVRASEERFQAFMAHAPLAAWVTDADSRLEYVSPGFETLTGLAPDEARGKTSLDLFPPEIGRRHVENTRLVLTGGRVLEEEERFLHPDGTPGVAHVVKFPMRGPSGDPRVGGVAIDVTAQRQAETSLRASEEKFRHAFDHAPIGVCLTGTDGRFLQANRPLCDMTGYTEAELLATDFQAITHPDDLGNDLDHLRDFLAGKVQSYQTEKRYIHKAGHTIHVHLSVSMVPDEHGSPLHFVCHITDITTRKRAEAAAREGEERFRNAFDHAPIGMAIVAPDGHWQRVNRRMCQIVGYTEAELLASDFQTITHPDDLDADLEYVRQMLAGVIPNYQMEKRYFHKAGHIVQVLLAVSLVRDHAGVPLHFISQIEDITAAKQAVAALRMSEERFRRLVEGVTGHAIFMLDPDGHIVSWNPAAVRLKGYAADEIIGRHFSVFYRPEEVAAGHPQHELAVAVAEGRYQEEGLRVRKDGSVFWADVTISTLRDDAGRHVGFVKFTHDITARKRAEEALRASEQRFRAIFDQTVQLIGLLSPDGTLLEANRTALAMGGVAAADAIGRPLWETPWIAGDPDRQARMREAVSLAAAGETVQFEVRLRAAGGAEVWADFTLKPCFDAEGRVTLLIPEGRDITARKQAEEQVRASLKEKEVLLKEIHHRVKNNLQIVSALLELQAGHTDDPAVVEMFSESQGRVRSMAMIHERLYKSADLARVDFSVYVTQLSADLYRTYKVSGDDIRLDIDIDIPPLPIDIAIPCGLLLNELISNCLKHAFKDADRGCLRVEFRRDPDGVTTLAVSDDGPGLPDGFDLHNTPSFGMQLVTTLVDQLDGEIAVTVSSGTTFKVNFPKKDPTP